MKLLRRIITLVLLFLLLLIAVAAIFAFRAVRGPFPQTSGQLTLSGLHGDVTVLRDDYGVPHIYAENEADLLFAQGFVEAQDRFWQMEFWRHIGTGRLSEIVGAPGVENDKFIRNMGWNRIAVETTEWMRENEPEAFTKLEYYAAGVNAYIEENGDDMSLNQTILGLSTGDWEIEPWLPLHTVAWGTVMAWDLRGAGDLFSEQRKMALFDELGAERASIFYPPYPDNRPTITQSDAGSSHPALNESVGVTLSAETIQKLTSNQIGRMPEGGFVFGNGLGIGSNNWVVSGEHTASGQPLLANDPHLGVQLPSIWYMVGLHSPELNVAGFSFAGVPGVVIGHNEDIAWGVTNLVGDSQDVYIEKINPANPLQYEFEGEWLDMEVVEETILVNGGDPVVLEVRMTHHGPLLNNIDDELTEALSVRWTAQDPSRLLLAVNFLNRAENYDDFRNALQYWDTAAQNIVYADREGNIAYQTTGRYPIRNGWDGTEPVPGWTAEFEWEEMIPYEQLPSILNPENGFISTANNAPYDGAFPYVISMRWASGDRAQRIEALLQAAVNNGNLSPQAMADIQNDNFSLLFESLRPYFDTLSSDNEQVSDAIAVLNAWNGEAEIDSVGSALFEVFASRLALNAMADEGGESGEDIVFSNGSTRVLQHQLALDETHPLWDDITTEGVESAETIILLSLADTIAWFEDNVGGAMDDWTWGKIHTIIFTSAPLGQSGISQLESIVNRGPFPVDGSRHTVNANSFSFSDPAAVRSNASMRMVVDLSDFANNLYIHPTGQSGHPYHDHYDDFIDLWLAGDYFSMPFERSILEGQNPQELILLSD